MRRLIALIGAVSIGWTADEGPPFMRLPDVSELPSQPLQIEALPGYDQAVHRQPISGDESTSVISQYVQGGAFQPDGTPNMEAIRATMKRIAGNVRLATVIPTEPIPERPLETSGWRLWLFWAPDLGLPPNVISQIQSVREAGFSFSQIPVISLRQWESWAIDQNMRKDRILSLMNSKDRSQMERGLALSNGWVEELGPLKDFLDRVVVNGVPIVPNVSAAITLQVKNVPCWRLVSPLGRVHCLNGFGATTPILNFCLRAKEWEESNSPDLIRAETPVGSRP